MWPPDKKELYNIYSDLSVIMGIDVQKEVIEMYTTINPDIPENIIKDYFEKYLDNYLISHRPLYDFRNRNRIVEMYTKRVVKEHILPKDILPNNLFRID